MKPWNERFRPHIRKCSVYHDPVRSVFPRSQDEPRFKMALPDAGRQACLDEMRLGTAVSVCPALLA
jgi:hypothetical protein